MEIAHPRLNDQAKTLEITLEEVCIKSELGSNALICSGVFLQV